MPKQIKHVLLCPNPDKDAGLAILAQAEAILRGLGVDTVAGGEPADLLLVFGGDGTILHHAAAANGVPILGVNLGRRGFMSGLEPDTLPRLEAVVRGEYRLEQRMMLDVTVERGADRVYAASALNDAVISRGAARLVMLSLYADGQPLMSFAGDGAVISTPTGSTAYAMAAGGPILEPEAQALLVTPICAHEIFARPLVLGPERTVGVEARGGAYLSVDGGELFTLQPGDRVLTARSAAVTRLVQVDSLGFYNRIYKKFGEI